MVRYALIIWLMAVGVTANAQLVQSEEYRHQLNEKYTSGLFTSDDAWMLVPDDDPVAMGSLNVFQYLQGRIPGLQITNAAGLKPVIRYRSARPAFFLNEMRVDEYVINSININDVALIKIFRPPFAGAIGNGAGGAIAVYTKNGDEDDEE
jgi:hypothetical protein